MIPLVRRRSDMAGTIAAQRQPQWRQRKVPARRDRTARVRNAVGKPGQDRKGSGRGDRRPGRVNGPRRARDVHELPATESRRVEGPERL